MAELTWHGLMSAIGTFQVIQTTGAARPAPKELLKGTLPVTNDVWRVWDRAKDYGDLLYQRAIGASEEMESSKALCKVLAPFYHKGMTLLDVGCGPGHYLLSLRTRLDEDIDYTGVDATEYYIELARKAFPTKARFEVGDIFQLPFADSTYDVVINNNLIHHLPPPPSKAIKELLRVSSGYVVIRTVFGDRNYIIKEIRTSNEGIEGIDASEVELVTADPDLQSFNYFNMYTETYFREMIRDLDPKVEVEIIEDTEWPAFDNREQTTKTGTRVVGGYQASGNLLLDWRFIVLKKG